MTRSFRLLIVSALALGILAPVQSAASAMDGTLDVEVETADRATGTIHTMTATLTAAASVNNQVIGFEIQGGPQDPDMGFPFIAGNPSDMECVTNASGVCTASHQATSEPSTSGTAQPITAWHDHNPAGTCPGASCQAFPDEADTAETQPTADADPTDTVAVTWYDPVLNLEPETVTTPVGVQQTLTVTVLEVSPPTPPAKPLLANVDVEITAGPNMNSNATASDFECNTAQTTGQCTVQYTGGTTAGADTARAHIDNNDNGINAPDAGAAGDESTGTGFEGDATEGQNEATTPGATAEPDRTDVVTVTRSIGGAPPPPAPPTPPAPPPGAGPCNKIIGKSGDDKLRGTPGCDVIKGRGGDDLLRGKGGNDRLIGGGGFDIAKGGPGNDRCKAEKEKSC